MKAAPSRNRARGPADCWLSGAVLKAIHWRRGEGRLGSHPGPYPITSEPQGRSKAWEGHGHPHRSLASVGHQGLQTLWAIRGTVRLPKAVGTKSCPSAGARLSSASRTSSRSEHRSSPGPRGLGSGDPGAPPTGQAFLPGAPGGPARASPSRSRKLQPSRSGMDSRRWFRSSAETVASMA